jgi:hypothetical protein
MAVGDTEEGKFEHEKRRERQGAAAALQVVQAGQVEEINGLIEQACQQPGGARASGKQGVTSLGAQGGRCDGKGPRLGGRGRHS